jgi:putative phosphoribosyl transferase
MMTDLRPPYRNRTDAGRQLTGYLAHYEDMGAIVLAIPRGGIPVAVEIALALRTKLDIIVPRKIPIPSDPEAGYGAVTEDGAIVLNEPLVRSLGLTKQIIELHAEAVKAEIRRRQSAYRAVLAASSVEGNTAIIVDDGLASGYTMMAAIESARRQGAQRLVAAAPVASSHAWELVKSVADEVISPVVSYRYPFAVAAFYRHWHDLTDEEVISELERFLRNDGRRANA